MSYGPMVNGNFITTDMVAPGAPVINSVTQNGNTNIDFNVTLPSQDHNGDALSGLTTATLVVALMQDGVNPFENLTFDQILNLSGVQVVHHSLSDNNGGDTIDMTCLIMGFSSAHVYALACSDN